MCWVFIGDIGEEKMYSHYLKYGGPGLEDLLCRSDTRMHLCTYEKTKEQKEHDLDIDDEKNKNKEESKKEDL
jgi:hypothetical protein